MNTPHKHAALIKAWADGAVIECDVGFGWKEITNPAWDLNTPYRIKPAEPEPERYRFRVAYFRGPNGVPYYMVACCHRGEAAIKARFGLDVAGVKE